MKESILMRMKKSNMLMLAVIVGLLGCAGVVYAAQTAVPATDWEWARQAGYVSADDVPEQPITQAQFLQMVMQTYGAKESGVTVPKGAENHWAAGYYATAKQEGIIDCSCQIKPDKAMTAQEAAKFVMLGINRKSTSRMVTIDDVQNWIPKKDRQDSPVTYHDAAAFIRKMDEALRKSGVKNE